MSNSIKHVKNAVSGHYKENFCRSLQEFHACLYLDKVKNVKFITEPFKLFSKTNNKVKIPDLAFIRDDTLVIVEIKPTQNEVINVIVDYASNNYYIKDYSFSNIQFEFWYNCSRKLKKQIINHIGIHEYNTLLLDYKNQQKTNVGFSGPLNPMFGKKHSEETKKIISQCVSRKGKFNGMYGKTHTESAKLAISKKWNDVNNKNSMLRKGFLTHVSKMNNEQKTEVLFYSLQMINGVYCKKPNFLNRAYSVSNTKVEKWFGNAQTFIEDLTYVCTK